MNREVANMIAEEASVSIDRISQIAEGVLLQSDNPNVQNRIYTTAPNQTAIEFLINHTLGMPGAQVEVITTTEYASRKIQGAKDRENGVVIRDHSILMLACEQQLRDFLPTAIDRLMELAAGVTVQYTLKGKTFTVTHKPSARSIDYITSRTEGRFASVLTDLREKFENPDLNYPYTIEDFEKMTQAEREALYDCALRNVDKFSDKAAGYDAVNDKDDDNINLPSNSPPSPACGRGDGGEGYCAGSESCSDRANVTIPNYVTTATKRLAAFLPTAIAHLKTLAIGAQTIIDSEVEQHVIEYGPDLKANMFFVNRFLGTAPTSLKIENIKPAMDENALAKLAAEHPLVVAKYGSIEAALAAAAQRRIEKELGYD